MKNNIDLIKTLFVMAQAVEAKDFYTGGHLWRVSKFSRILADNYGVSSREAALIALNGYLHDIGKIGVPDAVLNKPSALTDEEYEIIKTHPLVGQRVIAQHPLYDFIADGILQHHETPNGRGYPYGLSAAEISLSGQIVGLVDAFDAMTSTRPYRCGMPIEKALSIIKENLNKQFFPEVGEVFIELGLSGQLDHIISHSDDGIMLQECPACGPIMVVNRDKKSGDYIYCRNCSFEAKLSIDESGKISIIDEDQHGKPVDLIVEPDYQQIDEMAANLAHTIFSDN